MYKRFVLIYRPVVLYISLPVGYSMVATQDFKAGVNKSDDESIDFFYFKENGDNTFPPHIISILENRELREIPWEELKITRPSLTNLVSEGLLKIGVRI